ncbi:MAG: nitrogenase component 1 [Solidesulfovibrio sp. DCME]|uniref:nitrogenase component 1 n=1 Tax=Solidesulfovibrio sp. DCME TaxID=3447380 RepID=UPI003D0C7C16
MKKRNFVNVNINPCKMCMAHVSPGDVRHIKAMLRAFGLDAVIFPDISNTFDAPFSRDFQRIPKGGTTQADIAAMAGARATLEIGLTVPDPISPGKFLEDRFGVPLLRCPIPIGLANTDTFMRTLAQLAGRPVPARFPEAPDAGDPAQRTPAAPGCAP